MSANLPTAYDKPLFTPGPLTTSLSTKQAMLRDLGSRDEEFIRTVREVRNGLLSVAGVSQADGYEAVLMQGSGTFTIESVITSAIPADGKFLIIINGAYGKRISQIARRHGIDVIELTCKEDTLPELSEVERILQAEPGISMVSVVHCETTSGIINPIKEIGELVAQHSATYFVDSMSAFGSVPFDYQACNIDFLVSSANKCIEGVPGFAFAICKRKSLLATEGMARTISLDLLAQWQGLEKNGQFRFTPPTHSILAFHQALKELQLEGGVEARAERYGKNHQALREGMQKLGFEEYVAPDLQGHIITSFRFPESDQFTFESFYEGLSNRGKVIYPGKVSDADCFRIGNIGRLFESDVASLLLAIEDTLAEMGVFKPSYS